MKALILCGGQGTRFWPASRTARPKQFLKVASQKSLLQETYDRLQPLLAPGDIYFSCPPLYTDLLQEQIPGLPSHQVIVEPLPRNTAACIGLAAHYLQDDVGDSAMLVVPSDHRITDLELFHRLLRAGEKVAEKGYLVTFGIEPERPATGFGYIEKGESLGDYSGLEAFAVRHFTEKPDLETATRYVHGRQHLWNSGMFVWKTNTILSELEEQQPILAGHLQKVAGLSPGSSEAARIFEELPSLSIDFGVLEHSTRVAVLPAPLSWDDVGDWRSLYRYLNPDREGNCSNGTLVQVDSANCLGYLPEGKLVAFLGVEGTIVVDTGDALLVCDRERTQDIKHILDELDDKYL